MTVLQYFQQAATLQVALLMFTDTGFNDEDTN
jgi:hypothetical protein